MLKKGHTYTIKLPKKSYYTYLNKNVFYELGIALSFLLLIKCCVCVCFFFQKGVSEWQFVKPQKTAGMCMEGEAMSTRLGDKRSDRDGRVTPFPCGAP